jgi:hypothetical protein
LVVTASNHLPEEPQPGARDPNTGRPASGRDVRAEFDRLSSATPIDYRARQAFLETKIEMVRNDPGLRAEDKAQAIQELQRLLQEIQG